MIDRASIEKKIAEATRKLKALNPSISPTRRPRPHRLQKVLVANRGEIAKRFFLALHEEGIPSVAVVTDPDRGQSWYEFADEVVFIGEHHNYASTETIITAAHLIGANALYSGYGFLSENADFVEAIDCYRQITGNELIFMGPGHETIRLVGNKPNARKLAREQDIPLFESSEVITPKRMKQAKTEARRIGYPVMIKLSSGGGGKGMYKACDERELEDKIKSAARIGRELYQDDSFYLERYIDQPVHMEVQIFNGWAIGIRKCAVQRRNQKIIEESGHSFLNDYTSLSLLATAEKIAHISGYSNGGAGTIEFLFDAHTGRFGFMEVNTRLQVEYAVTDQSLGIDIAKWQILFFDGRDKEIIGLDILKRRIAENDHSIECRIYAEDPENNYLPSPGLITELDLPTFNGIRCDFGFSEGDTVLPMYDPLMGKLIAHGATRNEAIIRLERALQELYIKGIATNINQLLRIVRHQAFRKGDYTNTILAENPELSFREPVTTGSRGGKQVIFGAFTEHLRLILKSVQDFTVVSGIEGYIESPVLPLPPARFMLEYCGRDYLFEFIQTSVDTFHVFADTRFCGTITIVSTNERADDLLLIYGNSSYRIRVNRQGSRIELKMKDEDNKINYFRMNVIPEGSRAEEDIVTILAPFQGSFVGFHREGLRPGDTVTKGEPLVVLSSMKMETVISSPEDGEIIALIEDGDMKKLVMTRTEDGRVLGRSIQQRELLFTIKKKRTDEPVMAAESINRDLDSYCESSSPLNNIMAPDLEDIAFNDMNSHWTDIVRLLLSSVQGLIHNQRLVDTLKRIMRKIPADQKGYILSEDAAPLLSQLLLHYACVKKVFSPVLSESGLSYQEELNLYLERSRRPDLALSKSFTLVLERLLQSYGLTRWTGRADMKKRLTQYAFFLLKHSYQFCLNGTDLVQKTVQILSHMKNPPDILMETMRMLMDHEEAERDDSLLKFIRNTFSRRLTGPQEARLNGNRRGGAAARFVRTLSFREKNDAALRQWCAAAEIDAGTDPGYLPDFMKTTLPEKIASLEKNHHLTRLFSPLMDVVLYRMTPKDGEKSDSVIAFVPVYYHGSGDRRDRFDEAMDAALWCMDQHLAEGMAGRWIVLLADGIILHFDDAGDPRGGTISYRELRGHCGRIHFATPGKPEARAIIFMPVRYPSRTAPEPTVIQVKNAGGSLSLELLLDIDRGSPFYEGSKTNVVNQRLLASDKWPIETWASGCFDSGVMEEIRIRLVDYDREYQEKDAKPSVRPVGARIFRGAMGGSKALFYMKDSRVSGGSTGNWEGLKYIAACYLAYLSDMPLYIWNDSAGANIMEGVVSLNRGAEGFMMNTLLTRRAGSARFMQYVHETADDYLRKIFSALDADFSLSCDDLDRRHRSFQLVAVGIGPSAGLDVYGSSQASIQVLLDSPQSYRVLTGSTVIRTVIGEEISNYDIGGAKILGKWTGIVDIVAADKLHLIGIIQRLHSLFGTQEIPLPAIRRTAPGHLHVPEKKESVIKFSEAVIDENSDDGSFISFKDDYYASNALAGGFARLGGRRVLVMGARTDKGLKSTAAIIKARELLLAAHKTDSHQIIVYGKKWLHRPDYHENMSARHHLDLMDMLKTAKGVRIHFITDIDGLKLFDVNSAADILVYIKSDRDGHAESAFAARNAAFIVASYREAFDLALALINLMDPLDDAGAADRDAGGIPRVPADSGTPYEIVQSVITPAFDKDSFREFFREMNNPLTGPHLITGLASLQGATVGIIADQPLLKGGGADAAGTEKFRVFTEFLNRHAIPLVMLSNSSGFVPGSMQERQRIQAIGAESLDANILGRIPVVSVVLNQNYGGRLIQAYNKFLRPGIVYLALKGAVLAVIGVDAAFDLLYGAKYQRMMAEGMKKEAAELKKEFAASYLEKAKAANDAMKTGLVDWLIDDIRDLREHLVRGLDLAVQRCRETFGER